MPQLDFATYVSQFFWLSVCFVFLYMMLSKCVLPRLYQKIEERAALEAECMASAEKLIQEAETLREAYEKEVLRVRQQAAAQIDAAVALLDKESTKRHAELEQRLVEDRKRTDARMRVLKSDLMREMEPVTQHVAEFIYYKLAGKKAPENELEVHLVKQRDVIRSNKE